MRHLLIEKAAVVRYRDFILIKIISFNDNPYWHKRPLVPSYAHCISSVRLP